MHSLKLSISKLFVGLSALIACSSGFAADQGPVKFTPGSASIAKPRPIAAVRPPAAVRPVAIKPAAHSASPKLSAPGSTSSAFSPAAASSSSSSSQSSMAACAASSAPAIISSSNFVKIEGSVEEFKNSLEEQLKLVNGNCDLLKTNNLPLLIGLLQTPEQECPNKDEKILYVLSEKKPTVIWHNKLGQSILDLAKTQQASKKVQIGLRALYDTQSTKRQRSLNAVLQNRNLTPALIQDLQNADLYRTYEPKPGEPLLKYFWNRYAAEQETAEYKKSNQFDIAFVHLMNWGLPGLTIADINMLALDRACNYGHVQLLHNAYVLLRDYKKISVDPNFSDDQNRNMIAHAMNSNYPVQTLASLLQILGLQSDELIDSAINNIDRTGHTALYYAVMSNKMTPEIKAAVIKTLLQAGADKNILINIDKEIKGTHYDAAVKKGCAPEILALLKPNAPQQKPRAPSNAVAAEEQKVNAAVPKAAQLSEILPDLVSKDCKHLELILKHNYSLINSGTDQEQNPVLIHLLKNSSTRDLDAKIQLLLQRISESLSLEQLNAAQELSKGKISDATQKALSSIIKKRSKKLHGRSSSSASSGADVTEHAAPSASASPSISGISSPEPHSDSAPSETSRAGSPVIRHSVFERSGHQSPLPFKMSSRARETERVKKENQERRIKYTERRIENEIVAEQLIEQKEFELAQAAQQIQEECDADLLCDQGELQLVAENERQDQKLEDDALIADIVSEGNLNEANSLSALADKRLQLAQDHARQRQEKAESIAGHVEEHQKKLDELNQKLEQAKARKQALPISEMKRLQEVHAQRNAQQYAEKKATLKAHEQERKAAHDSKIQELLANQKQERFNQANAQYEADQKRATENQRAREQRSIAKDPIAHLFAQQTPARFAQANQEYAAEQQRIKTIMTTMKETQQNHAAAPQVQQIAPEPARPESHSGAPSANQELSDAQNQNALLGKIMVAELRDKKEFAYMLLEIFLNGKYDYTSASAARQASEEELKGHAALPISSCLVRAAQANNMVAVEFLSREIHLADELQLEAAWQITTQPAIKALLINRALEIMPAFDQWQNTNFLFTLARTIIENHAESSTAVFRQIIKRIGAINYLDATNPENPESLLMMATRLGKADLVNILLEEGSIPHQSTVDRHTPSGYAADHAVSGDHRLLARLMNYSDQMQDDVLLKDVFVQAAYKSSLPRQLIKQFLQAMSQHWGRK